MQNAIDTVIEQSIKIARYVAYQSDQSFEERTATILQYHCLSFLEKNPGSKASEIAKCLTASSSSTTQLVERLHKSGLVSREEDTTDRRVTHLYVTPSGNEMLKKIKEIKRHRINKLLSHIDEADIKTLIAIQEKLLTNIEKENAK